MAKLGDINVVIKLRTTISLWDAIKLRISGVGFAMKKYIETDIVHGEEEDASRRDRPLS